MIIPRNKELCHGDEELVIERIVNTTLYSSPNFHKLVGNSFRHVINNNKYIPIESITLFDI
jgi:hypothetical protein